MDIEAMAEDGIRFVKINKKKLALQDSPLGICAFKERFFREKIADFRALIGDVSSKDEDKFKLIMSYHINGAYNAFVQYANEPGNLFFEEFGKIFSEFHIYGVIAMLKRLKGLN